MSEWFETHLDTSYMPLVQSEKKDGDNVVDTNTMVTSNTIEVAEKGKLLTY